VSDADEIEVEVVYARADQQLLLTLRVSPGSTVKTVIERSGIRTHFPEIDLGQNKVGIFGKQVALADVVRERDRIEIYRALIADPKEVRRQRAAEGKHTRKSRSVKSPPA
jgi:putative ubiquitin-RnfH superfamily antitoxin RatB of RatAB toxin-antitoxin module